LCQEFVRSLDDPSPRLAAYPADKRLFAAPPDVRSNSTEASRRSYVRVVVAPGSSATQWQQPRHRRRAEIA